MIGALFLGILSAIVAALCTTADGALLGDTEEDRGALSASPRRAGPEEVHRALGLARLAALLSAGAFLALALRLHQRPLLAALAWAVLLAIFLAMFAEILPRALGETLGARLLQLLAPLVRTIELLFSPLVRVGRWADEVLIRLFPPATAEASDRETIADRFRMVAEAGAAPPSRGPMANRVFSLADTEVAEVMVPRVDIVGVEKEMPWSEVIDRVRSAEHARVPVYQETLDDIIGVLYAKDLLAAVISDESPAGGWLSLARTATFIPETKNCAEQLRDFKLTRTHIAIVVDEFGGTAGLLTIEDLLEEIVGDIRDEYDIEEPAIVVENGCRFWVAGRVTLDELSDALGQRFEHEDVSTVGGLIYEVLGRVPRAGEELTLGSFRVVVEQVRRRRVDRVYFEKQDTLVGRTA